ncbi:hypothetical protein N7462_008732 [Penicillium macrosclerotiorum]|uniref:uncharacterized protein n=1 Tax=Penicillium macrosclerotiorum TaxID=303699 RepID=UPI002547B625|nr:uncharacterized protein N7462_008732 [Penicillium macrosclerotiorum]KAJ5675835.1 hypothetical protein N7462_008732 [Penicillium macrosclerotiorum]
MVNWLGLVVPLAYLGVLLGSLATFSSLYRKRKAQKKTSVPESVLKAALLRRATEDIRRVMALRSQKQALSVLLQRGSVGDDLWQRFVRAEKEMEDEVRDVVSEANAYVPNWGQTIFQSANEMLNNDMYRRRLNEHQEKLTEEREWWAKKKSSIQEGFMKELNEESPASAPAVAPVATPAKAAEATPAVATSASVQGSDDDAVLVEAVNTPSSGGGGGGGGKKKKGKGKK